MEMINPINVVTTCPNCGHQHTVTVKRDDYTAYTNHEKDIMEAFPYLTPSERELLITGICDDCWEKLFPPEEA